jgi:leucyl aminopeptidase
MMQVMTSSDSIDSGAAIPLWLLHEDDLAGWLALRPTPEQRWCAEQRFNAERHRVLPLPSADGRIAAVVGGLGKRQGELTLWHAAGIVERLPPGRYALAQAFGAAEATQLCLGFAYGAYRYDRYRRPRAERCAAVDAPANADLAYVTRAIEALGMARDWINTPAADCGPVELAAAVQGLAARHRADYREWVGGELLSENFPAIHAVGRASAVAPRLCELRWRPAGETPLPKLILVGKGVCFDTGGLDLKPGSAMLLMKKDMGGAAVALGLAHLLMSAGLRAELVVLIPAVENAVAGNAYRPGDVIATRKGLSVEVGNTDAEGRLVLCDALALADGEGADLIIDFATLTGAARVALGPELPALFGSDQAIVTEIARIAAQEQDPLWPMPLWAPYDDELGSKIADLNNVASSTFAGAIFGALFLKRFVTDSPRWVHLDLYAWNPKERPGRSVGGEAQGLRGMYRYLAARYGIAESARG